MTKTYKQLYIKLYFYENLFSAFKKAKKRKSKKKYVLDFEKNLEENLKQLSLELKIQTYSPKPLTTFTIRDPKTRKISASAFRDRIIHHALINIIQPIFEKTFIYDSYANQKNKGNSRALKRFDYFKRKIFKTGFIFKADIKHYFQEINQNILLNIIKKKIKDKKLINLIKIILKNHKTKIKNKGMPLGNLTSQFFANVYLNELDYFVKHILRAKFYIRYVDDFVIFHKNKITLSYYKNKISEFLKIHLNLELHPEKSKIFPIKKGAKFLGFRIFYYYKLLSKTNLRKIKNRINKFKKLEKTEKNKRHILLSISGWEGYCKMGGNGTYKLRIRVKEKLNLVY